MAVSVELHNTGDPDELERRLHRLELLTESHHRRDATVDTGASESPQPMLPPKPFNPGQTTAESALKSEQPALPQIPCDEEPTPDYFWVVVCKNHRFHHTESIFYEHRILLGETDSYSSLPMLPDKFEVRCDSCEKEIGRASC